MKTAIELTGLLPLIRRLEVAQARLPLLMAAATEESLALVEARAKEILQDKIYDKNRPEFAPALTGLLRDSFVIANIESIGRAVLSGRLKNTAPYAGYLELGTDNEGTGTHTITAINAPLLHFINPHTGEHVFIKQVTVRGIKPMRFMEGALEESAPEIARVFAKHLAELFL